MGGLFSKPKLPPQKPPAPLPDEKALDEERRRRLAREKKKGGIASTVLAGRGAGRETLG